MDRQINIPNGIILLGCGKMGSALLAGWLAQGVAPAAVFVMEPAPSPWLQNCGVQVNVPWQGPAAPDAVILAVKPQMMAQALPGLAPFAGGNTLFLSIAAGTRLAQFAEILGAKTPLIRAMPNTPAAIGRGISAMIGNEYAADHHLALAQNLLGAVGEVVTLTDETQMDAVTAVSGSGPAYVFYMIEALTKAAIDEGLPPDLAAHLAKATICGAAELARVADEPPAQLRVNVTSPAGTTAAALEVLMNIENGLEPLMARAVHAATQRGRELGK